MRGVRPHKKTGILWLRLRTPQHLVERRSELEAMGVEFRVEHHRSLETRDRRKAVVAYAEKRREIESIWRGWEILLDEGPGVLSWRNIVALAGERAVGFLKRYEDEPFDAPSASGDTPAPERDDETLKRSVLGLGRVERAEFLRDLRQYLSLDDGSRRSQAFVLLNKYPLLMETLGPDLAEALETAVGEETDEALRARGLTVTDETRRLINLEMAHLLGIAHHGLQQRQAGDWGEVRGLHALPAFEPHGRDNAKAHEGDWRDGAEELTFGTVIEEQRRLSDLRLDKQVKSPETLRNYAEHCEKFAEWRGSRNILTVEAGEVAKYRDELIELADGGQMRRKTIINRVAAIRAVIRWAIAHNKRDHREGRQTPTIFPDGNPLVGIDLPEKQAVESEERTLTKGQARTLLKASREESEPILRWGQWLLTYSGMRIGEEVQLEKRDVLDYEGYWYLMVRVDDERTTKTRKSRRVPIHKAIIAEGFLEFVRAAPEGRLFGKPRQATKLLREWVHSILDKDSAEPLAGKPPLHGSRHLFRDIAMGHIEYGARNYIEGRIIEGSGEDYGRSAAMIPKLSKMMDEIEPLIPMRIVKA